MSFVGSHSWTLNTTYNNSLGSHFIGGSFVCYRVPLSKIDKMTSTKSYAYIVVA